MIIIIAGSKGLPCRPGGPGTAHVKYGKYLGGAKSRAPWPHRARPRRRHRAVLVEAPAVLPPGPSAPWARHAASPLLLPLPPGALTTLRIMCCTRIQSRGEGETSGDRRRTGRGPCGVGRPATRACTAARPTPRLAGAPKGKGERMVVRMSSSLCPQCAAASACAAAQSVSAAVLLQRLHGPMMYGAAVASGI